MKQLEKFISPLIAQMFPAVYRDEGPMFVNFVKAYYEWLETENQALYHARRLPEYRDIDTTIEDFIVYFKEKYLKNIQFETSSNKRLFIKNAIPFYRAKGTERSVDLFFKLIYGIPAKIYYPGDDLFKLSDGEWIEPLYLEVSPSAMNMDFIGKQIIGVNSNAVAFVEDLVVKRVKNRYVHVFFISNLVGNFAYDEIIKLHNTVSDDITDNPRIIGSFTSAEIVEGGSEFEVGETVNFKSANGSFAKAVVEEVESIEGQVQFELLDGGFGYNSDSLVLISNNVLTISNISNLQFQEFETVSQPLIKIEFDTATAVFEAGSEVFRYYANNDVAGSGFIVNKNQIANSGNVIVTGSSGNLYDGEATLFTTGNVISANIVANTNVTATGNVIGVSANLILYANSRTGSFSIGEEVYQSNGSVTEWANGTIRAFDIVGDTIIVRLSTSMGAFLSGFPIVGRSSSVSANLQNYATKIGVYDVVNSFYPVDLSYGNITDGLSSTANGYISSVSVGSAAGFSIGSNSSLLNIETSNVNLDFLVSGRHSNVEFDTSTVDFALGDQIFRYYANNGVAARGTVVGITQTSSNPNGYILVYTNSGNTTTGFAPSANPVLTNTFYTAANADSAETLAQTPNAAFYTSLDLDMATFGFPTDPSANLTSNTLANIFDFETFTIGTIAALTGVNPGINYNDAPYVRILEQTISQYGYKDYNIFVTAPTSNFNVGELVKQANSIGGVEPNGAIGQIQAANSSNLLVRRLLVSNSFNVGYIVGVTSGCIATIGSVEAVTYSNSAGFNAVVDADTSTLGGSVTKLRLVASGFGYQHKELAEFYSSTNTDISGTAILNLETEGIAEGFYKETGGFLSANKYIHDGHYYQEYSYDILAGLPFERYSDMFKKVLHVAGTRMYGTYEEEVEIQEEMTSGDTSISHLGSAIEGTVSGNTTTSILSGFDTIFPDNFANGDFIAIYDGSSYVEKRIVEVISDTLMVLAGPLPFTNSAANYRKVIIN